MADIEEGEPFWFHWYIAMKPVCSHILSLSHARQGSPSATHSAG